MKDQAFDDGGPDDQPNGLSIRARRVMDQAGISTPRQLSSFTRDEAKGFKGCGARVVQELDALLQRLGLRWATHDDPWSVPPAAPAPTASLRDYFAGQALVSMLNDPQTFTDGTPAIASRWCYKFADAMLEQRSKT